MKLSSSDDPTASDQATAALQQLKLSIAMYYYRVRSAHSGEALRQADDRHERPACLSPADPDVIQDIEELRQDVRRDCWLFPDVSPDEQAAADWAQTGRGMELGR